MSAPPSPFALLLFLATRSAVNTLRHKLARVKEPRYLVGLLVGAAYIVFVLRGPSGRRPPRVVAAGGALPEDFLPLFLLAASAVLLVVTASGWLLRRGAAALPLSEGEVQFLFPAPLPRIALVHFGLLRPQLGIVFSVLFMTLVFGSRTGGPALRNAAGLWIVLSAAHFHALALGFTKASWEERPAARRRLAKTLTYALAGAALLVVVLAALDGLRRAGGGLQNGHIASAREVLTLLNASPLAPLAGVVLAPFRALVAPLFARSTPAFLASLPPALLLLVVQYLWVTWVSVSFEEATAENAARRARTRSQRQAAGLTNLPSAGRRHVVPFELLPRGRPETAIVWKNLLAWRRTRLRSHFLAVAGVAILVCGASSVGPFPQGDAIASIVVAVLAIVSVIVASTLPLGLRTDLRGDLEYASVLRTWPVPVTRLAAAELLAPWLLSVLYLWSGLVLALAAAGGRSLRALVLGARETPPALFGGFNRFEALLPAALAAAVLVPALMALALILQNAAVAAFPAWFPPGQRRPTGLEQMGTRLLLFFGTFVALAIALIPSVLLGGGFLFLARKALGLWAFPPAALFAAIPVFVEAIGGVALLGWLLDRFDPALDMEGVS